MRYLINYLRSCFCKHEFSYEEMYYRDRDGFGGWTKEARVSATCKKCGYHKSYWKY